MRATKHRKNRNCRQQRAADFGVILGNERRELCAFAKTFSRLSNGQLKLLLTIARFMALRDTVDLRFL